MSAFGDYPKYATETYNELATKAKQRVAEGKELSQFDKDRMEYYGHVSGLSGKTNIPGTPLMVDEVSLDDIIEEQEAKNELAKLTGDWGDLETATGIPDAIDTVKTIPIEETELLPQDIVDVQAVEEAIERARAMEAAKIAEIDRQNRVREAEEAAAQRVVAEKIAQSPPTGTGGPPSQGGGGGGPPSQGGGSPNVGRSAPTNVGNPFGYRAGGRVGYGKGGIVDLLK